jgi:hypothetical protein
MGKVFKILAITLGIWVALEIGNNGMSGAFGGAFARGETSLAAHQSIPQRAGNAVQEAHDADQARRARLLGE